MQVLNVNPGDIESNVGKDESESPPTHCISMNLFYCIELREKKKSLIILDLCLYQCGLIWHSSQLVVVSFVMEFRLPSQRSESHPRPQINGLFTQIVKGRKVKMVMVKEIKEE